VGIIDAVGIACQEPANCHHERGEDADHRAVARPELRRIEDQQHQDRECRAQRLGEKGDLQDVGHVDRERDGEKSHDNRGNADEVERTVVIRALLENGLIEVLLEQRRRADADRRDLAE
jgi:hypothetical protein